MFCVGLRLGLKLRRAYLADFAMELAYLPIEFIVFYYIYSVVYSGAGELGGYTFNQLIVYIFASFILRRTYPTSVRAEIERDIHDGRLIAYLVRPLNHLALLYGRHLASFLVLLPPSVLVITAFQAATGTAPSPQALALFLLASLVGFTMTFELYAIIGLASYWLGRHHWLGNLLTLSTLILGGGYIPVSLFPESVARALAYLPLQAVYNMPASTISRDTLDLGYLASAMAWILVLLALLLWLEKRGLAKFESVGG